jgi:hypothetical protein
MYCGIPPSFSAAESSHPRAGKSSNTAPFTLNSPPLFQPQPNESFPFYVKKFALVLRAAQSDLHSFTIACLGKQLIPSKSG